MLVRYHGYHGYNICPDERMTRNVADGQPQNMSSCEGIKMVQVSKKLSVVIINSDKRLHTYCVVSRHLVTYCVVRGRPVVRRTRRVVTFQSETKIFTQLSTVLQRKSTTTTVRLQTSALYTSTARIYTLCSRSFVDTDMQKLQIAWSRAFIQVHASSVLVHCHHSS